MPTVGRTGKPAGKSGVTVGAGVDLGQMNEADLDNLVRNYDLSPELRDKLKPYLGVTREDAQKLLADQPLKLTEAEATQLTHAKHRDTLTKLAASVDKIRGESGSFDKLPDAVKTVYYDLAVQAGPNFLDQAPNMRRHLQNGDVNGIIHELRNYYSAEYNAPKYLTRRRNNEADILTDGLSNGTLKPRF